MSSFESENRQYDEEWTEEQLAEGKGGALLPDGSHQVIITESRIEWAFDSVWQFVLKFSNDKGTITKWQNLDQEIGRKIALQDARMLGYEGPLSGLEAACEGGQFVDKICEINIQRKPGDKRDFVNIYLNRVLGTADSSHQFVPAAAADDDIPF